MLAKVLANNRALTLRLKDGTVADVQIHAFNHDERKQIPSPDPRTEDFLLEASVQGKEIGYLKVFHQGARIYANEVSVEKAWRRKGLATELYTLAEQLANKHIYPGEYSDDSGNTETSDDAIEFWKSRGIDLSDKETESNIIDERFNEEPHRQEYRDALPFEGPWNGYGQKSPIEKVYPAISRVLARSSKLSKTLDLYRGIQDVFPSQVERLYKGEGVFGRGTYYGSYDEVARDYATGAYNDHSFERFAFVTHYKASFKNIVTLTEEDVTGLEAASYKRLCTTDTGNDKLGFEHETCMEAETLGDLVQELGFDGVELRADDLGVPDGGEQVLIPSGAKPNLKLLNFEVYFNDDELVKKLKKKIKVGEIDEHWHCLKKIPGSKAAEVQKFLEGIDWRTQFSSMLDKVLADMIDERFLEPDSGYRKDFVLPVDQTYGWGMGNGVAVEPNPFGGIGRAFAKATLPEDSELLQFYYSADAESWREQVSEDAKEEWKKMDLEERKEIIPSLISHGYSSHFPHEPKTEEEWNEVMYSFLSYREDEEQENADTSTTFFENAKIITNPTLIRFTDQEPSAILSDGFDGYAPENLGLTHHYRPRSGTLAFAFDKRYLKTPEDWASMQSKYGKNVFQFKVPYAVKAYHNTDGEDQIVFDVETVKDLKQIEPPKPKQKKSKIRPMRKGEKIPF